MPPGPGYQSRRDAAAYQREINRSAARTIAQTQHAIFDVVATDITDAVFKAVFAGLAQMGPTIQSYLRESAQRVADPSALTEVHRQVGLAVQRSTMAAYGQRVTRRMGPASRFDTAYQARRTRLHGKMREALRHSGHVDANERALRLWDIDVLDGLAAHWYRLNFGVGQRGQRSKQGVYQLMIEGAAATTLGFESGPSRDPLVLPPGFFVGPDGTRQRRNARRRGYDAFYPRGGGGGIVGTGRTGTTVRMTKGIEARNFFDAGLRRLARELPRAYEAHFRAALAEGKRLPLEEVVVSVPGLRRRIRVLEKPTSAESRFAHGLPI